MVEDQRFAVQRPDVLIMKQIPLKNDVTIAGKIIADLFVSTTSTDADFIVKVIDVLPDNEINAAGTYLAIPVWPDFKDWYVQK